MLRINDIQNRLVESEGGTFQKICNEILSQEGYVTYKLTGSLLGTNKTKKGTPDSVYIDKNNEDGKYLYVEITTDKNNLPKKIIDDVKKCLKKISENVELNGNVSRILFLHNQPNIDETLNEKIRKMCGKIKFDVYGIDTIASLLQTKYSEIATIDLGVMDDSRMIDRFSETDLNKLAQKISEYKNNDNELLSIDEIKNKIHDYYEKAIQIINNEDAIVEISNDNKKILKSIFDSLSAFDFYFNNKNDDYSKQYYHNMLVIISKYSHLDGKNYYKKMPKFAQENSISRHFYSMVLIENNELKEANIILEKLYFEEKYTRSFETLIRSYFLLEKYDVVIRLLSHAKSCEFDKDGFLASMLIISKNIVNKYNESSILKLNNSKFKKMPLFYACTSKMLYDLDKRKNKYKEQFKKCIKYLNETSVLAIITMCNQAKEIKLEDVAILYLESIELTPVLERKLIELLSLKNELCDNDIKILENIDLDKISNEIDIRILNAKMFEAKGKELEAIELFKKSFDLSKNAYSAYKYIQLSIKNKSMIEDRIITFLADYNSVNSLMISAEAYQYVGKYRDALYCSYKAIYMSNNTIKFQDACRQFWIIYMIYGKDNNLKKVGNSCVIILNNGRNNRTLLLEDDLYFLEGKKVLNAEIVRPNSYVGLELLQKERNEYVDISEEKYKIIDILDKYTYFAKATFEYIKDNKNIRVFTAENDSVNDSIEKIKQEVIEINKSLSKRLDIYQSKESLPLSALLNREKNFDDYAKLINTLLSDRNRVLLAGETINLDISNGFVIDISTLIILSMLELLEIIPLSFCKKIYITKSLKNKFKYFYDNLIKRSEEKENTLYVVENDKLFMNETLVINQIKFWKKLNEYIDSFQELNIESEKGDIFNKKTELYFDKVQFDLIELAKERNIPFISDDLFIRKICNLYGVKHTNVLQIIKTFTDDNKKYLDVFIKLSKNNYIYTMFSDTLSDIIKDLYENFNNQNKKVFLLIINSILDNKASAKYYLPIIIYRIECLKKVQYIRIFDCIYENYVVSFIVNEVNAIVTNKCREFDININEYV